MQQNIQIFQRAVLYLKHYASNMFRSVVDHPQGRNHIKQLTYKTLRELFLILYKFFVHNCLMFLPEDDP